MIGDTSRNEIAFKYYLEGFEDAYRYFYFNKIESFLSSIEDDDSIPNETYEKAKRLKEKTKNLFNKYWKIPDPKYLSLDELNEEIKKIGIRSDNRFINILDQFEEYE